MGAVVKLAHGYRLYIKGASEILTKLCRWHVVVPISINVSQFVWCYVLRHYVRGSD
jgi:hypothetical protein